MWKPSVSNIPAYAFSFGSQFPSLQLSYFQLLTTWDLQLPGTSRPWAPIFWLPDAAFNQFSMILRCSISSSFKYSHFSWFLDVALHSYGEIQLWVDDFYFWFCTLSEMLALIPSQGPRFLLLFLRVNFVDDSIMSKCHTVDSTWVHHGEESWRWEHKMTGHIASKVSLPFSF